MIDDEVLLESLHKNYPQHSFRITQQDRGRILYVDNNQVKISWIANSPIIDELIDEAQKMAIDQEILNVLLAHVNQVIAKKLEEEASRQIPELHPCLCGERPKLQIDFSKEENTPMVSVKCLCGLKGRAFEVKDAIKAACFWNDLFDKARLQ